VLRHAEGKIRVVGLRLVSHRDHPSDYVFVGNVRAFVLLLAEQFIDGVLKVFRVSENADGFTNERESVFGEHLSRPGRSGGTPAGGILPGFVERQRMPRLTISSRQPSSKRIDLTFECRIYAA